MRGKREFSIWMKQKEKKRTENVRSTAAERRNENDYMKTGENDVCRKLLTFNCIFAWLMSFAWHRVLIPCRPISFPFDIFAAAFRWWWSNIATNEYDFMRKHINDLVGKLWKMKHNKVAVDVLYIFVCCVYMQMVCTRIYVVESIKCCWIRHILRTFAHNKWKSVNEARN